MWKLTIGYGGIVLVLLKFLRNLFILIYEKAHTCPTLVDNGREAQMLSERNKKP
jgi:hypothetical protein